MNQHLQHTVGFTDEATPTRKAKPAGVLGAENNRAAPVRKRSARCVRAFCISGAPLPNGRGSDQKPTPTDPASFNFVALDPGHEYASRAGTRTPYTLDFAGADGAATATIGA